MSTFIKLLGINPPTTRPRVDRKDLILPEKGALVLLDPSHPTEKWFSGIPADGQEIPNIAFDSLKSLTKASDADVASSIILRSMATSKVTLRRSAKGGFGGKTEPGYNPGSSMVGASVLYPKAAIAYVMANTDHSYYASLWCKITSNTDQTHAWQALSASSVRDAQKGYLHIISNANTNYPSGSEKIGQKRDPQNTRNVASVGGAPAIAAAATPHNFFASIGLNGYATPSGIDQTVDEAHERSRAFGIGNFFPYGFGATAADASVGGLFYRAYLEDLTVSGRTYAEVEALDYAAYLKDVTKSGGRYYGDS